MPVLPIPLVPAVLPTGSDLPVRSVDDVLAVYPEHVRREETAPVRDAIVEAEAETLLRYQERASYAAAQSDPTQATGMYLEGIAAEVDIHRQGDEDDESLRDRYFAPPEIVTPNAIKALVNAMLAPFTATPCELYESILDRWYVNDGTAVWHSFVGDGIADMTPDYPDRRYVLRGNASPGGPMPWSEGYGRCFVIRVPNIAGAADFGMYAGPGTSEVVAAFIGDGTGTVAASYVFPGWHSADAVFQAIADLVESVRGMGIRWIFVVDPKLEVLPAAA